MALSVVISVILGVSVTFGMITLQESTAYFNTVEQTKEEMNEFNTWGIQDYTLISAKLYNTDGEDDSQLVERIDKALKEESEDYLGMLRKQSDSLSITLIPKRTENKSERQYKANNYGVVGYEQCFGTGTPLVLEDTYKNMSIYDEFDKDIMCKSYTVDQQIPVYISSAVKEKYGLDTYADGVIALYNEDTDSFDTITLNCKIIGTEDTPSFSMNTASTDTRWEIALPFITNSDGTYLISDDNILRTFVFQGSMENYAETESLISKYALVEGFAVEDISLMNKYYGQISEYPRYTVEIILSYMILAFAVVLAVTFFYIIYNKLWDYMETKKSPVIICAVINILVFLIFTVFNYRIEFSNDFIGSFAVPSATFDTHFVLWGCVIFAAAVVIFTAAIIWIQRLCQKRSAAVN